MKVLFAHSFFLAFDEKQQMAGQPYPPLGTLIAASMVRNQGLEVGLFDAMIAPDTQPFFARLNEGWDACVFFEDNFNWLSKMCLSRMRQACTRMIAAARAQNLLVVVAGSDASDFPEVFLDAGADYVIKGEAEFRLLDILDHHLKRKAPTPFEGPGIFHRRVREPDAQPARGVRDQSLFPQPAWDLVELDRYRELWQAAKGYFSLNIMTTRGCPYRCNWCAKPIHGRRYDVRDPSDVAEEQTLLKQRYGAQHIWFTDDIFGLKPGWLKKYAEETAARDGLLPYTIQGRADLIKAETVLALRLSGCKTVWMGVESGSQKVLDAMDKDLALQNIYHATRLLQEAHIEVCFFLQFGYPGETEEDIALTWKMVADLKPDQIGISVAYPLPGTPFYERVKAELPDTADHWEHSHHMKPIHRAHFPAHFYPLLHGYFHQHFKLLHGKRRPGLKGLKDRLVLARTERKLRNLGLAPFTVSTP